MLVRQEEEFIIRSWQYALVALGVFVWVIAVVLMVEGSILRERTAGIATLLRMVGLFIILITYTHTLMLRNAKKEASTRIYANSHSLQKKTFYVTTARIFLGYVDFDDGRRG